MSPQGVCIFCGAKREACRCPRLTNSQVLAMRPPRRYVARPLKRKKGGKGSA